MSEMHESLNEYVDGSLNEEARREIERRLDEDPALRRELAALREIVDAAGALPRSIDPERDLWPGIESRIRSEKVVTGSFAGWKRNLLAVAALLAIFAVGLVTGILREAPSPEEQLVANRGGEVTAGEEAVKPIEELEQEYASASVDLFETLGERADRLDPVTIELIRRNLDIIDEAVKEIRGALEDEPSNPQLNRMLTGEYRRRSALLRQAADLPEAI